MKTKRVLSLVLSTLLIFSLFLSLGTVAFAGEDLSGYFSTDIAVINNIIENNALTGYEKNAPSTWDFVESWVSSTEGKKVGILNLEEKNLTGILDVSGLTELKQLLCNENQLTGLNVSGLVKLFNLECNENKISELNLSGLNKLWYLECNENQLSELNVAGHTELKRIFCRDNKIASLNLSGLSNLSTLQCSGNLLTTLDVSDLSKLEIFRFFDNEELTTLTGLGNCTKLEYFTANGTKIIKLDMTPFTFLKEISCCSSALTELKGLQNKTNLKVINVEDSALKELDVTGCTALNRFWCLTNEITEIKGLSDCTSLSDFICDDNKLTFLDVSKLDISNTNFRCEFSGNYISEITLPGGKFKIGNTQNGKAYITSVDFVENKVNLNIKPDNGFVFDGWYSNANMNAESKVNFDGIISTDTTIYSKFSPIISDVTVNELPQTIVYGDTVDLKIINVTVANGYNVEDVDYKWYEGDNVFENTTSVYQYNSQDTNQHTIKCDITLDNCTVTKTFTFTVAKKPITPVITLTAPMKNEVPQTSIENDEYTATVVWSPVATDVFLSGTEYAATITITPKANYTLDGINADSFILDGATSVTNAENSGVVTAVFPQTEVNYTSSSSLRYTVSFVSNGGSRVSAQKIVRKGTVTEPTAPTKSGYTFDCWYVDSNLTNKYDFSDKVLGDITLYAKWIANGSTGNTSSGGNSGNCGNSDNKEDNKNEKNQIILTIGNKNATVFGEKVQNDVAPIIRNDRTMLPARFVAESLGAKVEWNEELQQVTITKDDVIIVITIGSDNVFVNGEEKTIDSPAFIENDRTYTPIRFISEELGATVTWDEINQTVIIEK